MFPKDVRMGAESLGVRIPDEPDDILHRPGGWVLVGWSLGLLGLWRCVITSWKNKRKDGSFTYVSQRNKHRSNLCLFHDFSPVLLLSGNVFGLLDDCRHMLMEAELLENCCDERNP